MCGQHASFHRDTGVKAEGRYFPLRGKENTLGFQDVRKKTRSTFEATETPQNRFLSPWPALREDASPLAGGTGSVLLSVPRQ